MRLRAYGLTDKGRIRPTNEDCFAVREDLGLCVIADGLGGHNAGEVAARLAVDAVVDYVDEHHARCEHAGLSQRGYQSDLWPFGFDPSLSPDGNLLRTAVHAADLQIRETASASQDCAGMGTTIVAVRVASGRLSVAHAGDSRLYLLAGGTLRQVTQDDSWIAAMLADDPDADPAMLALHPMRNALTNVVGAKSRTEVHVVEHTLAGGELLVLSTDGVHGVLDGRRIEEVVREEEEPRAIAHAIVSSALTRGSRDNCTAVVARCVKM